MLKLIKCEFLEIKAQKVNLCVSVIGIVFPCYFGIYDKSRFDGRYDRTLSANPI